MWKDHQEPQSIHVATCYYVCTMVIQPHPKGLSTEAQNLLCSNSQAPSSAGKSKSFYPGKTECLMVIQASMFWNSFGHRWGDMQRIYCRWCNVCATDSVFLPFFLMFFCLQWQITAVLNSSRTVRNRINNNRLERKQELYVIPVCYRLHVAL